MARISGTVADYANPRSHPFAENLVMAKGSVAGIATKHRPSSRLSPWVSMPLDWRSTGVSKALHGRRRTSGRLVAAHGVPPRLIPTTRNPEVARLARPTVLGKSTFRS